MLRIDCYEQETQMCGSSFSFSSQKGHSSSNSDFLWIVLALRDKTSLVPDHGGGGLNY